MAQASSAQREPSMEEILASIRRIIEDSDSGRKAAEEAAAPAARQDVELDRVARSVIEVDSFRAELRAKSEPDRQAKSDVVEPAPTMQEPRKMPSLADIQSEIAREGAAKLDAPTAPAERKPVSMAEIKAEVTRTAPAVEENRPPASAATPETAPPAEARPAATERLWPSVTQQAPDPIAETHSATADLGPAGDAVPAAPGGKPLIISEHASRQIAASFSELSEAFQARSRRTFDELAEQMMRPMLQDWLDNNLPLLVERLVREEIERVARGV